jgi:excinuclease ABC subunit C
MGQDTVGSMVVFQDGLPKKAHYRKFGIRGQAGMDDFAAMGEMVSRRFARLAVAGSGGRNAAAARPEDRAAVGGAGGATADDYDESFAATPNLVVVDGGKGQLAAAIAAMQAFDLPRVAVIALAKREEEVFVPGQSRPVVLSRHDPGLQLLQRIRDEAHRFAVGFHRQRRESRGFASLFDELEGVGPARRRALLNHFGSVDAMIAASPEELEGVPGVPAKVARQVYAQLHKAGRG